METRPAITETQWKKVKMEPTEIDILFFKEKEDVILSFILFNQQIPRKDQNQQHVGAIHYILKMLYLFYLFINKFGRCGSPYKWHLQLLPNMPHEKTDSFKYLSYILNLSLEFHPHKMSCSDAYWIWYKIPIHVYICNKKQ